MNWKRVLFYTLAAVAPGGFVVVAGYHGFKLVRGRMEKARLAKAATSTEQKEGSNGEEGQG